MITKVGKKKKTQESTAEFRQVCTWHVLRLLDGSKERPPIPHEMERLVSEGETTYRVQRCAGKTIFG